MTKDERQAESIEKWRQAKGRGTLNLVMRFGKTRIAAMIVAKFTKSNPCSNIMAIAPNVITTKNLIDHLTEFCTDKNRWIDIMSSSVLINHINKLRIEKKLPIKVDLLILDEVDKLLSGETLNAIKCIDYKYILCLTGSNFNKKQLDILKDLNAPIVDHISEVEAVSQGWIANSIEYNLAVNLDEHDKIRYAKYSEQITETLAIFQGLHRVVNQQFKTTIFDSDFSLILAAFTGIKYKDKNGNSLFIKPTVIRNLLADIMGWSRDMKLDSNYNKKINANWNPDNIYERAKKFKDFVKQRNDILVCNRPKINAVIQILKRNSVPTICFNESITMVDTLADYFSTDGIPYHSTITSRFVKDPKTGLPYCYKNGKPKLMGQTSLKKLAIDGIKNGIYKYLFTARSLNEGLTIENIEQVITTGGDCNSNTYQQRIARGKTYNYLNPNKICVIINLYIDDFSIDDKEIKSRDKQKLIQRQSMSENIPIWVNSIEEIFD